jgi:hypothetical protein
VSITPGVLTPGENPMAGSKMILESLAATAKPDSSWLLLVEADLTEPARTKKM